MAQAEITLSGNRHEGADLLSIAATAGIITEEQDTMTDTTITTTDEFDASEMTKNEMIEAMRDAGHIDAEQARKMGMPRCKKAEVVAAYRAMVAEYEARQKAERDAINGTPAKKERKAREAKPTAAEQKYGKAGLQLHTDKNRTTGTACSMYKSAEAGIDGEKYAMVCESHNFIVTTGVRKVAGWDWNHPELWCEECQKLHAAGEKYTAPAAEAEAPQGGESAKHHFKDKFPGLM